VGQDKGSLTEQQTNGTVTTTIQIRRKHDKTDCRPDPLSRTGPAPRVSSRRAAPPTGTQHDGIWYGIPCCGWPGWGWVSPPGCAPSWILVKINPVLAEPRTPNTLKVILKIRLNQLPCKLGNNSSKLLWLIKNSRSLFINLCLSLLHILKNLHDTGILNKRNTSPFMPTFLFPPPFQCNLSCFLLF